MLPPSAVPLLLWIAFPGLEHPVTTARQQLQAIRRDRDSRDPSHIRFACSEQLPGRQVPELNSEIATSGEQVFAIRRDCHRQIAVLTRLDRPYLSPSLRFPYSYRSFAITDGKPMTVRGEGNGRRRLGPNLRPETNRSGRDLPHPDPQYILPRSQQQQMTTRSRQPAQI